MIIFSYIALLFISVAVFYFAQFFSKKVKIPPAILYLFIGILFGVGGLSHINKVFYLFGDPNTFIGQGINAYNSVAVLLLFFGAGYSIDLTPFTKAGKANAPQDGSTKDGLKLAFIPVYFEIFVMTILGYLLFNNFPGTNIQLSFAEVGIIAGVFAVGSPALVIPACMKQMSEGKTGSKNLTKNIIVASIADNFTPMPLILIFVIMVVGGNVGININPIIIIPITIILIVVIIALSLLLGKVVTIVFEPISKKVSEGNLNIKVLAIILFITMFIIITILKLISPALSTIIGLFGIVLAAFMGTGINYFEKNKLGPRLGLETSNLFAIFGMPIMFLSVGSSIDITQFTRIPFVLLFICIIILSISVKSIGELYVLSRGYNVGDKKFAIATIIAKGITLVNFSIVLLPMLGPDATLIKIMASFAAIALTVTLPISIVLMNNKGGSWLESNNIK